MDRSTVAGWSSGTGTILCCIHFTIMLIVHFTGAAGVGGALVFTALSTFLDTRVSILIQLVMPLVMLLRYL